MKLGRTLLIVGLALQVFDIATRGKVFSAGGFLEPVDRIVPKLRLPWPQDVQTNLAFWLIVVGAGLHFSGR